MSVTVTDSRLMQEVYSKNMDTQSTLQLMDTHISVLFQCDLDGKLRFINEPDPPPAPRFFMGRTAEGNRWRFRHDLPADLIDQLEILCQAEPIAKDFRQPHQQAEAIRVLLNIHAPIQDEYRGPDWWIPQNNLADYDTDRLDVVLIDERNCHLVQPHFAWIAPAIPAYAQDGLPVAATVVEKVAVALCFCSRIPAGGMSEAGVETVAAWRGKGYATAAVAFWAKAMYHAGLLPLYGTSWENLASQRIASKLGMIFYGEDWSIT